MAEFKYINRETEANLVLLALAASNRISRTPITKEGIQLTRDILDQMDKLYDTMVDEAERRERAVLESDGI